MALFLFCCPFFSYLGVLAAEAGMVDLKDLKPLLLRTMVNNEEMMKLMQVSAPRVRWIAVRLEEARQSSLNNEPHVPCLRSGQSCKKWCERP